MTKAEIVSRIAQQTGIEKEVVMTVVEAFMENVKDAMIAGKSSVSCPLKPSDSAPLC